MLFLLELKKHIYFITWNKCEICVSLTYVYYNIGEEIFTNFRKKKCRKEALHKKEHNKAYIILRLKSFGNVVY